ncbi:MAG TPA: ABC transporter permease [Acidimicrobiales bacterium]|nr:ABC transporter permease [Acidimicrobiales bacterium]
MSSPVLLVAQREITGRLRSRAFRISTAVSALGLVAMMAFAGYKAGQRHEYKVAHTAEVSAPLLARIKSLEPVLDATVTPVPAEHRDAALALVRTHRADIALIGNGEIILERGVADQDISPRARFVIATSEIVRTQAGLEAAGLPPEAAAAALASPPPKITPLEPAPPAQRGRAVAFAGVILLFFMIQSYAVWVSTSVTREKTSRLSELLLVNLRPQQLLTGKLLGVAVLAIGHALLLGVSGLGARTVIGGNVLADFNLTVGSLLWPLAWFLVGFALYASLYAAAGSMVKTQEDAPVFPLFALLFLSYISASTLLSGGDPSLYHRVLSWFPLTAPFNMLAMIGIGAVSTWHALASLAVSVATVPLVLRLSAAIYSAAIARTGQKVKWSEALRPWRLQRTAA